MRALFLLCLLFIMSRPTLAATNPCEPLPAGTKTVGNNVFPTHLAPPFDHTCFVAYIINNPLPNETNPPATGDKTDPYIAFSLDEDGKILYKLPLPEDYLWNTTDDNVTSVAFRKLNGDQLIDIVIIGHTYAAGGVDRYVALIYRNNGHGFTFDTAYSEGLIDFSFTTMPELLEIIATHPHLKAQ